MLTILSFHINESPFQREGSTSIATYQILSCGIYLFIFVVVVVISKMEIEPLILDLMACWR